MHPSVRQVVLGRQFAPGALVAFDFVNQRYRSGANVLRNAALIPGYSFTRSGPTAYAQTAGGLLVPFAAGVPRITDKGYLAEEARINYIRNNQMVGALAGSPGTLPTSWFQTTLPAGILRQSVALFTENGIPFIRIRYAGTASASGALRLAVDPTAQLFAAPTGSPSLVSAYLRMPAGSKAGFDNIYLNSYEYNGEVFIQSFTTVATGLDGTIRRLTQARTTTNAAVTHVGNIAIYGNISNGANIDITLDIGLPQAGPYTFELSPIPTTTAAATRGADALAFTGLNVTGDVTILADIDVPALADAQQRILDLNDGTDANKQIVARNSSGTISFGPIVSSVNPGAATVSGVTTARQVRIAGVRSGDNYTVYAAGVASSTVSRPGALSLVRADIGSFRDGGSSWLNGYLRSLYIYPRAFSAAEAQVATQ